MPCGLAPLLYALSFLCLSALFFESNRRIERLNLYSLSRQLFAFSKRTRLISLTDMIWRLVIFPNQLMLVPIARSSKTYRQEQNYSSLNHFLIGDSPYDPQEQTELRASKLGNYSFFTKALVMYVTASLIALAIWGSINLGRRGLELIHTKWSIGGQEDACDRYGSGLEEAKALGCSFDILREAWLPSSCIDVGRRKGTRPIITVY